MGNTVFFWVKKLMERWCLLVTEKFLFRTFRWLEMRGFFSAKMLMERLYLHGLFELSVIFQDLGNMVFRAVEKASYDIIKIYRFTKLIFGWSQSPYILEDSFKKHLKLKYTSENYIGMFRELIERVKDDMYVEDLVTGGEEVQMK